MKSLRALQEEWLDFPLEDGDAGPFLAYAPPNHETQRKRILYVGKASDKDYNRDRFLQLRNATTDERIQERIQLAEEVFNAEERQKGASFWGFARGLSLALDSQCKGLKNLAWTNLCKIGANSDVPSANSIKRQSALAAETFAAEIAYYKPSVIVAVSNDFAEKEIFLKALEAQDLGRWQKSERADPGEPEDVWWLNEPPPVLWMRHPQYSRKSLRSYAIQRAVALAG